MIPLPVLYHHLWRIPFLRFNAQAFCWLSSREENRTSPLLSVCISLLYFAWRIPHTITLCCGWYLLKMKCCFSFNGRQCSKLCGLMHCFSHRLATSKIKHLLLLMCICIRLTCWNIRRFPKDWMTISRPQRTPSLLQRRAPQGLPRNPWASPGAQSGPTESDEGTPCLQMFVFVLEGLRF